MERRSRGDGGIHWSETRGRWIGEITIGYDELGKRKTRKFSARTKAEARLRMRELLDQAALGIDVSHGFTVEDLIEAWLANGLHGRSKETLEKNTYLARGHIVPLIGKKQLRDLRAPDVDRMLAARRRQLSTSTLQRVLGILRAAIKWGEARDLVGRNVAMLVTAPTGTKGRPSKSMTLEQAQALLRACADKPLGTYVELGMLTGARNEELRALTWDHVDLAGEPPSIKVWRSVRTGGDTKTRTSRRTLAIPGHAVDVLEKHRAAMQENGLYAERGLVFCTREGTALDAANVRRSFRAICKAAGLDPKEWTPRELRHSFVSLMSEAGVPLEDIARFVGHVSTKVTETIYRKQLSPVLTGGAEVMDTLFDLSEDLTSES